MRNYTPHEIALYRPEDAEFVPTIRKYILKPGAQPVKSIPSSGMLSVRFEDRVVETEGVIIARREIVSVDPLPEGDDYLVVSALFAMAAQKLQTKGAHRLLTIGDPVYADPDAKRPVGCLKLIAN